MSKGHELEIRYTLIEKKSDNFSVVYNSSLKVIRHLRYGKFRIVQETDPAQQEQWKHGADHGAKNESAV